MVFMQSKPVWVGDLGNSPKTQKFDGRLENRHFVLKRNSLVKNVKRARLVRLNFLACFDSMLKIQNGEFQA
jgi:hypothetical protein